MLTFIRTIANGYANGHGRVPTVTIDNDGQPLIINEADFDPKKHKVFEGETPAVPPVPAASEALATPPVPTAPAAPPQLLVMKKGKGQSAKFFVADEMGRVVEDARFAAEGYATEEEAKAAIAG